MDFAEARKEIQFWMDFVQHPDISKMSPEEKGAIVFKILSLFSLRKGDADEGIFRLLENQFPFLQHALLKYFNEILDLQQKPEGAFDLPDITRAMMVFDGELVARPITMGKDLNAIPDVVKLRVFDLMAGRSINIIKRCVVCRKMFCYLPKENKRYCSPQCLWRASKKRYRDKKRSG